MVKRLRIHRLFTLMYAYQNLHGNLDGFSCPYGTMHIRRDKNRHESYCFVFGYNFTNFNLQTPLDEIAERIVSY